jgi:hypothetical protein
MAMIGNGALALFQTAGNGAKISTGRKADLMVVRFALRSPYG